MKILYAASEALPYIASGGLADVAGSLPVALNAAGNDCRGAVVLIFRLCRLCEVSSHISDGKKNCKKE